MLLTTSHSSFGFVPSIPRPYARPPCSHQGGAAPHSAHAQDRAAEIAPYLRLPSRWLDRWGLGAGESQNRAQTQQRHADDRTEANGIPHREANEAAAGILLS